MRCNTSPDIEFEAMQLRRCSMKHDKNESGLHTKSWFLVGWRARERGYVRMRTEGEHTSLIYFSLTNIP